jgi:hypothetical protein
MTKLTNMAALNCTARYWNVWKGFGLPFVWKSLSALMKPAMSALLGPKETSYQLRARKHNLSTLLLKIAGHNPKYLMGLKAKFHLRQLYQVLE